MRNCRSPFHSESPDSINSFPSLISGVLQVVNGDQFALNDSFQLPAIDSFKGFGFRECTCLDGMCDVCCSKMRVSLQFYFEFENKINFFFFNNSFSNQ